MPSPTPPDAETAPAEPAEVLALPFEMLRAASGHPITVSTADGQSAAEFRQSLERGRQWHIEHGLECPPPPSDARIAELIKPLGDLG